MHETRKESDRVVYSRQYVIYGQQIAWQSGVNLLHCHYDEITIMSKQHHYLSLHKVTAGMVLADNLLDKLGHVLLPSGTALTETMLTSLAHHNIHQLSILIDNANESEHDYAGERQIKLDRLAILFRQAPYDPPTSTLLAYVQKYRSGGAL